MVVVSRAPNPHPRFKREPVGFLVDVSPVLSVNHHPLSRPKRELEGVSFCLSCPPSSLCQPLPSLAPSTSRSGGFRAPNTNLASRASKWGSVSRAPNPHLRPKRERAGLPLPQHPAASLPQRGRLSLSTSHRRRRIAANAAPSP
jgi:hypothetical protein